MTSPPPTVAVRGEAELEVDPELARLLVTVSARDRDRGRTLARLTERLDAVRHRVASFGAAVERADTGSLWVQPEYQDSRRAGERVAGYLGSAELRVTVVDFSVLGELLLSVADQEMTVVAGPSWGLRSDSPVHREAREQAVHASLERARQYAAALGATLTGLVELADQGLGSGGGGRVGGGYDGPPPGALRAAAAPGGASPLPQLELEPVKQRVRATVEARWTMSPPTGL
ncbi:SIMPL domain-containing protein [Peterkaempfera griseoplana]|uniref:SIMPL domain-containing protein n=1 Tax=Peterkaempfera griseoplana TaxID=66896 RepID=UPI0006E336AC|nr:SIMPL domain-containing protein [Peterkaempfera griseoplana]